MTNPRNNNPFATETRRIKNEHDANRALVETVEEIARLRPSFPEEWELVDPHNEWGTWNEELRPEELERIEAQADVEELRHNGYWD